MPSYLAKKTGPLRLAVDNSPGAVLVWSVEAGRVFRVSERIASNVSQALALHISVGNLVPLDAPMPVPPLGEPEPFSEPLSDTEAADTETQPVIRRWRRKRATDASETPDEVA